MIPAAPAARGGPLPLGPWILPLILLLGASVYVNSLGYQLVWDDVGLLRSEPFRHLGSLPRLLTEDFTALTDGELAGRYYRPVQALSLAVDTTLWGLQPGPLRLTNLLLHLLATALVFGLVELLGAGRLVAALAALVFTLHPAHAEAVVFVSARDNLWVAVTALTCLWAHRRAAGSAQWALWMAAALAAHLLATLSKEVAVVVPMLLTLADGLCPPPHIRLPAAARWRWAFRRSLPYFGISLAFVAFRVPALLALAEGRLTAAGLWERLPGALEILARYLRLLFLPAYMQPSYAQARPLSLLGAWPALGLAALVALLAALAVAWRRAPFPAMALAWILITLTPVVDLIPVSFRTMGLADRYLVLPSVGASLLLAWTIAALLTPRPGRPRAACAAAGWAGLLFVLVTYPAMLLRYVPVWQDNLTLFSRMVEAAPSDPLPLFNLGLAAMEAGDHPRAIVLLERSLALDPARPRARATLGLLYVLHGRAREGSRIFDALQGEAVTDVSYYVNRAKAHVFLGESAQAVAVAAEGLLRFPRRAELHEWLGRALDGSGRPQEAIPHFRQALASDQPLVEEALGLSLAKSGELPEAVMRLRRAAEALPNRAQPRRALAIVLEAQGQREASLSWWREILALTPSGPAAREAAAAVRRLETAGGAR